jgi:hypothetical protein
MDDRSTISVAMAAPIDHFRQLQAWRERGYNPELLSSELGWFVRFDTERCSYPTQELRTSLRFATGLFGTPQAAIEAALQVVQP